MARPGPPEGSTCSGCTRRRTSSTHLVPGQQGLSREELLTDERLLDEFSVYDG